MITLHRTVGWELRLAVYWQQRRARAFAWGDYDCATAAAGAVQALTECPVADLLPGAWVNRREAVATVRRLGGLRAAVSAVLGEPQAATMARIGDIGLVRGGARRFLAVCNGDTWLGPGPHGLVAVGLLEAECCWRVG